MKIHLPPEMNNLLLEVARKHLIDVATLIVENRTWQLSDSDREILIDVISTEFTATGLLPNSEPNERGLLLEELLDKLNN